MDICKAIRLIHPNAEFTVNANDYNQIVWLSDNLPMPSFEELEYVWTEYKENAEKNAYKEKRQKEFSVLDGNGMDAMRKELISLRAMVGGNVVTEMNEYLKKVQDIKNKYPKS